MNRLLRPAAALLCTAALAPCWAAGEAIGSNPMYRLVQPDYGLPLAGRFGGTRLEAFGNFAPRHELRLSAMTVATPAALSRDPWSGFGAGASLLTDPGTGLGATRATYRYTVAQSPDWAWKVGITANLREISESLRAAAALTPPRFSGLPMLHVAGEGRLAPRWTMAFDADGLVTGRGRALDLGLRVDYALSRGFSLYGGYRLTDTTGEADEVAFAPLGNTARFGLRYRF